MDAALLNDSDSVYMDNSHVRDRELPSDNYSNDLSTPPLQMVDAKNVDLFRRIDYSVTTE